MILIIGLLSALITGLIQVALYKITKKKFTMFIIPVILAIPTIYFIIKYYHASLGSPEFGYGFLSMYIG